MSTPQGDASAAAAAAAKKSETYQGPRRIGQYLFLKPSAIEEYKKCHASVWPKVLEQIKDSNIADYSIFLSPSPRPTLFASFKYVGNAYDADMARMAANPVVREWWAMTDGMQESPVEGAVGSAQAADGEAPSWWGVGEEVFYLE